MQSTLNGQAITWREGRTYREEIASLGIEKCAREILGVYVGGKAVSLDEIIREGDVARTFTYLDPEGRRVYERSLRFVFLLAVKNLFPGKQVRMENSAGRGLNARIFGVTLTHQSARAIKREMDEIVKRDLAYSKRIVSREEAMALFEREGFTDKVRLLRYRSVEEFPLYECGGMYEYFYGEMAPSTGYVPVFDIKFNLPYITLILPERGDVSQAARFCDQPQLSQTFTKSAKWAEILGCSNAADLNEMVEKKKLREFIRINEALHAQSIIDIARRIIKSEARLILIAGPSSSGKTTFAHRLSIDLQAMGHRPMKLSLDDYYIDRDKIPLGEDGAPDLERLDTLDVALFNEHLVKLLQGEEIQAPIFDFKLGKRITATHALRADPTAPILVEGIHGLNEALTAEVPRDMKFMVYISALTTLNLDDHNRIRTTDARLLRRLVRDHSFRGTDPEATLSMWRSVRRGEELYIFPYQESADVMFNSTLMYELTVLKRHAYDLLNAISPESPHYTLAQRLVKFLDYIHVANVDDEIPNNSILREFIGGCCYYREED